MHFEYTALYCLGLGQLAFLHKSRKSFIELGQGLLPMQDTIPSPPSHRARVVSRKCGHPVLSVVLLYLVIAEFHHSS